MNGPPAAPSSPPPSSPPSASDTSAPDVSLSVVDSKLKTVRKRRSIRLRLQSSEPATVGVTVRAGKAVIASTTLQVAGTGASKTLR